MRPVGVIARSSTSDAPSDFFSDSHEEHVAAGLKASMHNPNVSDNAKDRSARRLREMGASDEAATRTSSKKGPSKVSVSHIDDTAGA